MPFSTAWENKILDHAVGDTTFALPSPAYAGLAHTASTKSAGGTEPATGDAYARVQVTWGAAASGSKSNSSAVVFPQATGDWGGAGGQNITNVVLYDSASGATGYIGYINVTTAKKVLSGEIGRIEVGDLDLAFA